MRHIFVLCFILVASCAAVHLPQNDASLGSSQDYDSLGILENDPPAESSQNDAPLEYSQNYESLGSLGLSENYPSEGSSQNGDSLESSRNYASLGLFKQYPYGVSSQNDAYLGSSQNDAYLDSSQNDASAGLYENYPSMRRSQDDTSLEQSRFGISPRSFHRNMVLDPMNIIHLLIRNLQMGAQGILNIVRVFSTDIIKEGIEIRKNITSQMQNLGKQIMEHLQMIPVTLYGISASVKKCYFETKAGIILNGTINPLSCVGDEIEKVGDQLQALKQLAADAIAGAADVIEDVKYCKNESPNMLAMGVCLGETALQAQLKSVAFLSKSALLIARTNLIITSVPMSIEVCVGGRLAKYSSALLSAVLEMTDCLSNEFVGLLVNKSLK